jgi:chromosome condensin MukBEF MukE localization factor
MFPMSSLNTFGAILTYAIDLETRFAAYYRAAERADRAAAAEKRRTTLERVRRENVTEIKLEPIEGLSEDDYAVNWDDASDAGQRAVEQSAARFYADVAPKINVREAQRALERAGKDHAGYAAG